MPGGRNEQADRLARNVLQVYEESEERLIDAVARRTARGIDADGWAEQKLREIQLLKAEVQDEIRRLEKGLKPVVEKSITEAYQAGEAEAIRELGAGYNAFIGTNKEAVRALVNSALTGLEATHIGILRSTVDEYRSIIGEVVSQQVTGAATRRQVTQAAVNRFASSGIRGFVDKANRSWGLDTYSEMSTRTASTRARVEGRLQKYVENGHDLVIISDSPEECPVCQPWEGKVLSITGATSGKLDRGFRVAGTLDEAKTAGLFHPNCTHNATRYIPGATKPFKSTEAPPGTYEASQKQRYFERQVRKKKRELAAARATAGVDKSPSALANLETKKRQVAKANGRLTDFIEAKGRQRLRYRESPVKVRGKR